MLCSGVAPWSSCGALHMKDGLDVNAEWLSGRFVGRDVCLCDEGWGGGGKGRTHEG